MPWRRRSSGTCAKPRSRISAGSPGWPASITRPRHRQPAAGRRADARQHLQQLGLAVARDAGDADDLAGAQLESDIVEQPHAARVDQGQVLGLQQHLARLRRRLVELQQHLAADHQLGQLLGAGIRRCGGRPRSGPGA